MCGITGALALSAQPTDRAILEQMTQALFHRGPDGFGIAQQGRVGLGHRRLRILDLSTDADQPMWNDARDIAIVFNGEMYNFREIRRELEAEGVRFRTSSDTEVVLALYEREGENAVRRLDGMFALAVWDGPKRRLVLARDRAGQKPLFYYDDGERFLFASEIKALHRHPAVSRQPNLEALPLYLTYGYFPSPLTAYENIHALEPATWMVIEEDGSRSKVRYWTPPYEVDGIHDLPEACEQLKPLLREAVQKRLLADVPLGAFLSGGLDSTIVVGLMSQLSTRPVKTFSIGFEGAPDYDEVAYAEEAARAFGCEHTSFHVAAPKEDLFERLLHHHDGPYGDSSAIPTFIVSELARRDVTVVLNGDGGDELFAGYSRHAAAALSERVPRALRQAAKLGGYLLPSPRENKGRLRRARSFLDATALPLAERIQTWCSFFRGDEAAALLRAPWTVDPSEHYEAFLSEAASGSPLARLLYLNFCTYLPEDLLVKMDRMSMAHGLEARSPFLDTRLTEFAGQLPDRFKLRGLATKVVLREAFGDLVPDRIKTRAKMGFGVPLGAWFRNELEPYVTSQLTAKKAPLFEHLREDKVGAIVREHMEGRRDRGQQLFCLLTLASWLETF
jgi:asparagine synthase (glutamine-hydrolysing)